MLIFKGKNILLPAVHLLKVLQYNSVDHKKKAEKNPFKIPVSDLTYIRVSDKWNYICLFFDVFNRQISGQQCRKEKERRISI